MDFDKYKGTFIAVGVGLLVFLIAFFLVFDITVIKGNEIGVKETWSGGVVDTPLRPRTYFVMPWERIQKYPTSVRVFVMNDKEETDAVEGRDVDSYLVQAADSQDMHLSLQVQWRIDPAHVIDIHTTVGPDMIEEKILRPTLLRVVKDAATRMEAIEAYAGEGLVKLQQSIEDELNREEGELRRRGVIVDSFVIEHIRLDDEFVGEIKARQVATQRQLRAVEEEKAAQAEALKAKAEAQADLNRRVVEAERDKQVAVLEAEQKKESTVLAAEAEKEKEVLAAEAEKEASELRAQAILAIGQAEAEAEKLKFSAYSADGAERFVQIEVARHTAEAFKNIKGYLPESMQIFTLGESFNKAIENVVAPKK